VESKSSLSNMLAEISLLSYLTEITVNMVIFWHIESCSLVCISTDVLD
jgi:hypothetical protein